MITPHSNHVLPVFILVFHGGTGTLLETLARRMPAKDAEMLAKHWGYLEDGSNSSSSSSSHSSSSSSSSSHIQPTKVDAPIVPTPSSSSTTWHIPENIKDECLLHPTLGEKLIDLGYKKMYLTNVSSLAKAPIWEKQRILRPDRASRIALSKVQAGRASSFIGVITLFEDKKSGRIGIVDGQHRAAAYLLLSQQGHVNGIERKVVVDVFSTESDEEITALFKEINSAEPIRLIDMPGEGASEQLKELLDAATDQLTETFAEMFKPSLRCKPPHLNVDIFRDEVFQSEVITRNNLKTSAALIDFIARTNDKLSKLSDEKWEEILLANGLFKSKGKLMDQAIKKARTHNFFLGLDSTWMNK